MTVICYAIKHLVHAGITTGLNSPILTVLRIILMQCHLNELSSAACGAFYVHFIERYYLDFHFKYDYYGLF